VTKTESGWAQAIASISDSTGVVRGTAFLVGDDVALTCNHVIAAANPGPLTLKVAGSEAADAIIDMDTDEESDLALLRVSSKVGRPSVRLSPAPPKIGRKIHSRGFPRDHNPTKYPDGFPLDPAEITGDTTLMWKSRPAKLFVLSGATADRGMSGAPAVDAETETVVGVLRFSEVGSERALAIPASDIIRRWPKLGQTDYENPPTFEDLVSTIPESLARTAWQEFRPQTMHCLVLGSEGMADASSDDSLEGLFQDVMASSHAGGIWKAFRAAHDGHELLYGKTKRTILEDYSRANVQIASFQVNDALSNQQSFELAVRLIVEADLVLVDITRFEPAIMLFLGIRAATKRGVTINSVGSGWREGEPLNRPFNLSDLSLSSHSANFGPYVGDDPRIDRLTMRIQTGFMQLARQPSYEDLPVYDSLRRLGSAESASSSIPVDEEVLVLCSYDASYFSNWNNLRRRLRRALGQRGMQSNVARLQDLPTPQLVSQSLYERIRRCAACVCDWTGSSPSTFFELGVRLAVSPWGAVQIASAGWLDHIDNSPPEKPGPRRQVMQLKDLMDPLVYSDDIDTDLGSFIAERLLEARQSPGITGLQVRRTAGEALRRVQEPVPHVVYQLAQDADSLNHPARIRSNVPQALFYEIKEIKENQERAAIDRRLAAWLFLEHVSKAADLELSDERHKLWRELGDSVAADLFLSDDLADQDLALLITERIK
jgi:hypothetical protein